VPGEPAEWKIRLTLKVKEIEAFFRKSV